MADTRLSATPSTDSLGGKYLTFFLDGEEYGLGILSVHEIIGMLPITRVPRLPDFIRGVVNLRGKVIPVVGLRLKFGLEASTAETCIIVVHIQDVQVGIVVDQVSEVTDIAEADIDPTPAFGTDVPTDFLLGIGKASGKVRLLLDIERVLGVADLEKVKDAAQAL